MGREFNRSTRNNPCQVCGDIKGKCQTNYEGTFVLCMNTHSEVNGWYFRGINKTGIWGMHSLTDAVLGSAERLERKHQRELAEQAQKEAHRKSALPVKERNKYYRKISHRLGLATEHIKHFLKRGLNESQIELLSSFTLEGISYLSDDIPSNLPCVRIDKLNRKYFSSVSKLDGTGTFRDSKSFFCPAFDYEGNIIGGQFRHNRKQNKYTWLKGIKSAHLANGELPITFVSAEKVSFGEKNSQTVVEQWLEGVTDLADLINHNGGCVTGLNQDGVSNIDDKTPNQTFKVIMPLEGFLKPYVASCLHGVDTMGASGFNFSSAIQQVTKIITDSGYNLAIFPLDAGAVTNPMIMNQLEKNVELFKSLGCQIAIAWWGQVGKTEKPEEMFNHQNKFELAVDEDIATDRLVTTNELSFKAIGKCQSLLGDCYSTKDSDETEKLNQTQGISTKDFDEIDSLNQVQLISYEAVKEISRKENYRKWKREQLQLLTKFTPDKIINRPRFYGDGATSDPELDNILDSNQITIIKGSKASGKSYLVNQIIKAWRAKGGKVINIGCRRVLCQGQSYEWQITYIADAEENQYGIRVVFEQDAGISAVVDSLLKIKNLNWEGCLIVIDEIEQFVPHTLTANTAVKDKRGYILQALEDKFQEALTTGGKIIGLDADASDLTSEWLEGVTGIKPFKLENISKSHNNNAFIFRGDRHGYNDLVDNIFADLRDGEKIFIASDSRKDLEALLLELQQVFPNLPMEIITSDTVADKYIRDFIKMPDKSIEDTQVAMLGGSPVMQSGVSINIKNYFTKVYGICTGIIEPSVMRQLLIRVRDGIDRYLWISDKPKGVYANEFDWQKILKEDFAESLPDLVQYFQSIDENLSNREILAKISQLLDENDRLTDINSVTKAKITARRNLVLSNYRENLINELKTEGYGVDDNYSTATPSVGLNLSETKKQITKNEADNIYSADNITECEAERLKNKAYPSPDDKHKLTKFNIKNNLPLVTLSPLFIFHYILKDRWKLIQAVKRFWFTQNQEIANHLDTKAIHYQSKVALTGGKFWLEDIKANAPYVELFERLGLSEFINDDLVINKNGEQIRAFFERCKNYHRIKGISNRELLRSCGIKFKNTISPIALLTKVLRLFGHKTQLIQQSREEGNRVRNYRIVRNIEIIDKDSMQAVVDGEQLWNELINSFDNKYKNLEPIEYDFEVENEDSYYSENYGLVRFEDKTAINDTEYNLEPVTHPTVNINNTGGSVTASNQDGVNYIANLKPYQINEDILDKNNDNLVDDNLDFWLKDNNQKNPHKNNKTDDDFWAFVDSLKEKKEQNKPQTKTLLERFSGWLLPQIDEVKEYCLNQIVKLKNCEHTFRIVGYFKQEKWGGGYNIAIAIIKANIEEATAKDTDILAVEETDLVTT